MRSKGGSKGFIEEIGNVQKYIVLSLVLPKPCLTSGETGAYPDQQVTTGVGARGETTLYQHFASEFVALPLLLMLDNAQITPCHPHVLFGSIPGG
jgi:hypothetical protein